MIRNILHRWHAPTPDFWKRVQRICFAIAAMGQVMAWTPTPVPTWLGNTITAAFLASAFLSEFTGVKPKNPTDAAN